MMWHVRRRFLRHTILASEVRGPLAHERRPEAFFHDSVAFMSLTKHLDSIIFNTC